MVEGFELDSHRSRMAICILAMQESICLNFTIAAEYGGRCNLRFDDTNPAKESQNMWIR